MVQAVAGCFISPNGPLPPLIGLFIIIYLFLCRGSHDKAGGSSLPATFID